MLVKTAPEFEARAKKLERVYRLVYFDVAKLIADLNQGPRPQDRRLPNIGMRDVYKA